MTNSPSFRRTRAVSDQIAQSIHCGTFAFLILAGASPSFAATLQRQDFNSGTPWPGRDVVTTAGAGSVTATPSITTVGSIDTYLTETRSNGLRFQVNSSAASGTWSASVRSGILDLLTANSTTNLGLLTLSFQLSASSTHPIIVKIESFSGTTEGTRTGGLRTVIHPITPDYDQRFAIDLSSMVPDGAGTFNPANSRIRLTFELSSTAGPDGWPASAGHEIRVDNVNYATPAYYVKPASLGGNNSNSGLTEAAALATPQAAINKLVNGDGGIIVVRGGAEYLNTNTGGNLVTMDKFGAPDSWIVLKNYPGENPVLKSRGWGVIRVGSRGSSASPYTGSDIPRYFEARGLTVRGLSFVDANGDRQIEAGFESTVGRVQGPSNTNGIYVEGRSSTFKPRNFRFADNIVEFCAGAGIASGATDRMAVENNVVRYNAWWMIYAGSGISFLDAVNTELGGNTRMLVAGNVVYGNECMIPWWSNGNNYSDGNGIIIDSYDATYTGRTVVQNNLVFNNGGSGIHVLKAWNVDIVHNTAYFNSASTNQAYGEIFTQSFGPEPGRNVQNVRLTNNIMFARRNATGVSTFLYNESATSVASANPATIFHNRNIYGGGDVNPPLSGANLSNNTDLGRNADAALLFVSPSTDPNVADFRLRPSAAARNYGQAIGYRATQDIDRTARLLNGTTDTGVYQTLANRVASPIFSPRAGNFSTAQSVSLTSDTVAATIIFTTDGSTPSVDGSGVPINGAIFSPGSPIAVSAATTLKAIAWKAGQPTSPVSTSTYTFADLTNVPISLELATRLGTTTGGIFPGTQVVQPLTRTPGAQIRFTTNGTDPTATTGTPQEYRGYTVTDFATVRYRAFKEGRAPSAIVSATITIRAQMGNTADGASNVDIGQDRVRYVRFQAPETFSAATIFARIVGLTGRYSAAIYSDSGGAPNSRLAVSNPVVNPATGWTAFPLTVRVTLSKDATYWLAIWSDNASAGISATSTGGTVREKTSTFSSTWPTSAGTTTGVAGTSNYAIYATNAPPNLAPVVAAGPDQNLGSGFAATLAGSVSDDGVPVAPGTVTSQWTQVSGPGSVTFANAANPATTATVSVAGNYVLRLTARDALLTASDEVTIIAGGGGGTGPVFPPTESVIYRETFGHSGSGGVAINASTIGWSQFTAANSGANVVSTAGNGNFGGISSATGRPVDFANVNAGTSASLTNGFVFNQNATNSLVFTTEFPINPAAYQPAVLAWMSQVSAVSGTSSQSAAVRIDGQWYVSAPANNLTTIGSAVTFTTGATLHTVDFATAEWRTLAAVPGAPFAVGTTAVSLPAGTIDAFGVYFATSTLVTTRFDTFTVTGTPTPLQTWRLQYFNPTDLANPALESTVWGSAADPNGDGIANLMAYALGLNPFVSSPVDLPAPGRDETDALTLTFLRARGDVTYRVIGGVAPNGEELIEENPGIVGELVTVSAPSSIGEPRFFLRLEVTQP